MSNLSFPPRTSMSIPRFYYPGENNIPGPGGSVSVAGPAAHHALKVIRLRVGDRVVLFNGCGGEFSCVIENVNDGKTMMVRVEKSNPIERDSSLNIMLVQAINSSEKMDYLIQKAVEVGVSSIQPISTERSIVKLDNDRAAKRFVHWQNLVVAACEQCGRNRIPNVHPVLSFSTWLDQTLVSEKNKSGLRLMMVPSGSKRLAEFEKPLGLIDLLIGPEGGFSAAEETAARNTGFHPLNLGPRILRTETAAVAAISAMQVLWGDY